MKTYTVSHEEWTAISGILDAYKKVLKCHRLVGRPVDNIEDSMFQAIYFILKRVVDPEDWRALAVLFSGKELKLLQDSVESYSAIPVFGLLGKINSRINVICENEPNLTNGSFEIKASLGALV